MTVVAHAEPHTPEETDLLTYMTAIRQLRMTAGKCSVPAGFKYFGFEDFLLQHGMFFVPRALPPTVHPMTLSQCYENAYRIALRTKAFHYVEGIAIGIIPVMHAWLVSEEGYVIDPTWASRDCGIGTAYYGVELDLAQVKKSRRGGLLSLSDDYRRKFPILRGEAVISPEAWFTR